MKRLPNGYLIFSGHMRRILQEDEEFKNLSFGEISRIVGVKVIKPDAEIGLKVQCLCNGNVFLHFGIYTKNGC